MSSIKKWKIEASSIVAPLEASGQHRSGEGGYDKLENLKIENDNLQSDIMELIHHRGMREFSERLDGKAVRPGEDDVTDILVQNNPMGECIFLFFELSEFF